MVGRQKLGRVVTSVSISPVMWQYAVDNNLNISEATRIGLSVMLGDLGVQEYDNQLNLVRKMNRLKTHLEEKSVELEKYIDLVNTMDNKGSVTYAKTIEQPKTDTIHPKKPDSTTKINIK